MEFDRKNPGEFFQALREDDSPKQVEARQRPGLPSPCMDLFAGLEMDAIMDFSRAAQASAGQRPYRVFSVVVVDGVKGETVLSSEEYLPRPLVNFDGLKMEATEGGTKETGQIEIKELSPYYSEDQIRALFPTRLEKGQKAYYEVFLDTEEAPVRRRFALVSVPFRDAFGWSVKAQIQRTPRDRDTGNPQAAHLYPERMR